MEEKAGYGDGDSAEYAAHRVVDQRYTLAESTESFVLLAFLLFLLLNSVSSHTSDDSMSRTITSIA